MTDYNCVINIFPNDGEMSLYAAGILAEQVIQKPCSVIGTATGGTAEQTYELWGTSGVDARKVKLVQLDQYVANGTGQATVDTDYLAFVVEKIAGHFPNARRPSMDNIHVLNRSVAMQAALEDHLAQERYGNQWHTTYPDDSGIVIQENATGPLKRMAEEIGRFNKVLAANPRDIQVLGLGPGPHPHIAFNDYRTDPAIGTHLVRLYAHTRNANARFFDNDVSKVPKFALTQGPTDILDSSVLLTMASGPQKAEAVRSTFLSGLTRDDVLDASARSIRLHDNVVVTMDRHAADYIMRDLDEIKRDYDNRQKSLKIEIW